jgi:multiple sugar transport system permease protein
VSHVAAATSVTAAAGSAQAAQRGLARGQARFFALCVGPSLAVLALVTLAPAIYLFVNSLTPLDLTRPETIGDFSRPLENYRQMLSDGRLHNSVWVQAKLSFWTVGLQLLIGLAVALLLNLRSRFLEALRTVFLIPMVLPPIVVAIIWKVLYTPDISPAHWMLAAIGLPIPSLITDPDWALTAIILADTWQWFPFTMLMILSALQMMPQEMVDAAKVDGASPWQMTWHVTLPFLRGVLLVAALFRLIDSIKAFPLIYILTDGGPGSVTEVTNYYSFQQAFNFSFLGYSGAITVVLLATTVAMSWAIVRAVGWGSHAD